MVYDEQSMGYDKGSIEWQMIHVSMHEVGGLGQESVYGVGDDLYFAASASPIRNSLDTTCTTEENREPNSITINSSRSVSCGH